MCRPLLFASSRKFLRALECTTTGFFIIIPSCFNLAMFLRLFAKAISFTSFGSNQIFRSPHFSTDAANRFCNLRETTKRRESKNEEGKDWVESPHFGMPSMVPYSLARALVYLKQQRSATNNKVRDAYSRQEATGYYNLT